MKNLLFFILLFIGTSAAAQDVTYEPMSGEYIVKTDTGTLTLSSFDYEIWEYNNLPQNLKNQKKGNNPFKVKENGKAEKRDPSDYFISSRNPNWMYVQENGDWKFYKRIKGSGKYEHRDHGKKMELDFTQ